ncbi:MAG TPA: WYL domain-containing protein [Chitinispirillaceae bacterium]|nr:WYL domain-containing protein [Chitinispirillaceae bacterium]
MEKLEKIYSLHRMLSHSRYSVPLKRILDELSCSKATFYRLKAFLMCMGAPIEFSRKYKGYYYDLKEGESFELPGIWFTSEELQAFATLDKAVNDLSEGYFADFFRPFRAKLDSLIKLQKIKFTRWKEGVKILPVEQRKTDPETLKTIISAILSPRRLEIVHKPLGKEPVKREISPQTIVRYKDNWYVDAWCHKREGLRTFSIDRIISCSTCKGKIKAVKRKDLDSYYGAAFGIFTGAPRDTAVIEFSGIAAEEVSREQWHPLQESSLDDKGTLTLKIPYSDSRELIMDILRWGELAEVKGPESLREEVRRVVREMGKRYGDY